MKNERLASTFASFPYETRVLVSLVEALLGQDKVERVLTDLENPALAPDVLIEGRPLRFYSGLTDEQLNAVGLSKAGKEELYSYYDKPIKSGITKEDVQLENVDNAVDLPRPSTTKTESTD